MLSKEAPNTVLEYEDTNKQLNRVSPAVTKIEQNISHANINQELTRNNEETNKEDNFMNNFSRQLNEDSKLQVGHGVTTCHKAERDK